MENPSIFRDPLDILQQAVILLAEDDPGDQELTRRAVADGAVQTDLRIVSDGQQAMDYLLRASKRIQLEVQRGPRWQEMYA